LSSTTPTVILLTTSAALSAATVTAYFYPGANQFAAGQIAGDSVIISTIDLRPTNDGVGLPVYQRVAASTDYDTAGFPIYLRADGSNDYMLTNSIDFSVGATNAPYGPDIVTNGDFSGGSTGWTLGTGWSVGSGVATKTAGVAAALSQNLGLVQNRFYSITLTVTATAGNLIIRLGASTPNLVFISTNGTFTYRFAVPGSDGAMYLVGDSSFAGTVDNVIVRELLDSSLAPDKMTVVAGVRKLSDAAQAVAVELGATGTDNGSFTLSAPRTATTPGYGFRSRGTVEALANITTSYPSPITNVLSGTGDISGDSAVLYVNGAQAASSTSDQGTGNYGNYPLYLFGRGGTSLFFNGRFYGLIVRGAQSNPQQLNVSTGYMNEKTKAY
jgi:hypothetical protein